MTYDGCESVCMDFEVTRAEDGTLTTTWVLPWDVVALVNLCDSSITDEEALAVGRIALGAAMTAYAAEDPGSSASGSRRMDGGNCDDK